MKSFLIKILVFCCLFLLAVYPLICFYEYMSYKCYQVAPFDRINMIYEIKDVNADVIITGNSRADNSYSDSIISQVLGLKCLNIAWSGYPFNYQYYVMIQTYLSQNEKPKCIVQEIGPWAFLDYVGPKYTIEMMPYVNRNEFSFLKDICPEITDWYKYRLIRYSGKIDRMIKELAYMEWQIYKKKHFPPKKIEFNKNYLGHNIDLECDTSIINLFVKYVKECSNNNINLVFACSPMHKEFGQNYFDMDGFWEIFNNIAKDNGITVLNYQDLFGNDTTYFTDPMHLNKYGKEYYSKKIAHDLDSMNIVPSSE